MPTARCSLTGLPAPFTPNDNKAVHHGERLRMSIHRVREQFADNIEHTMKAAERLPESITLAGDRLVSSLLEGGRLLASGDGSGALWAEHLAALLLRGQGGERPPLPALTLAGGDAEQRSGALRALGQSGDTLVLILPDSRSLEVLLHAARDRDVRLVLITDEDTPLPALQDHRELVILLPSGKPSRRHESALLVLHTLCDHIEQQLFGDLS
jgi:phosphoheptose isomerase